MHDGKIVELEDGSLWRVGDVDAIDSGLWLPHRERDRVQRH
jgi:hypothetical protein